MAQIEGYVPYSPYGETHYVLQQVQVVLHEYKANLPLTLRQIFYRLVAMKVIDKSEKACNNLYAYIRRARRASMLPAGERGTTPYIPFAAIRDDSISVILPNYYADSDEFHTNVMDSAKNFKLDRQLGQEQAFEIWCEASGIMPILDLVAEPYGIAVYSSGGMDKITPKHELALRCAQRATEGIVTRLLHVGDFDPTGERIHGVLAEDIGAMVEQLTGSEGWYEIERVAMTPQQIHDRFGTDDEFVTAPANEDDNNYNNFLSDNAWLIQQLGTDDIAVQLEALKPDEVTGFLRTAIASYIDMEAYNGVLAEEKEIRKRLVGQYSTNPWTRSAYKGDKK